MDTSTTISKRGKPARQMKHLTIGCLIFPRMDQIEYARCSDTRRDHGSTQEIARTSSNSGRTGCLHRFTPWRTDWASMGRCGFENLVIHVRRSVVMMVQGTPKTEASAKDVPLDAALAESLLKLRLTSSYNRETDWVFASPTKKGSNRSGQTLSGDDMGNRQSRPRRSRSALRFTPSGIRTRPCSLRTART